MRAFLRKKLIGVYLHGSLALGGFQPDTSDIDLLAVVQEQIDEETARRLVELLLRSSNAPCPLEMTFCCQADLHPFTHPLPFVLHYSEKWREPMQRLLAEGSGEHWNGELRHDPNVAMHITVTRQRGITLYGQAASSILPVVPLRIFINVLLDNYRAARVEPTGQFASFVLNACRTHAYLYRGQIYSKDEGGTYALLALPDEFGSVIKLALAVHQGDSSASEPYDPALFARLLAFFDQTFASAREV
jgi:streptomycin 3"-adenylyltransferase